MSFKRQFAYEFERISKLEAIMQDSEIHPYRHQLNIEQLKDDIERDIIRQLTLELKNEIKNQVALGLGNLSKDIIANRNEFKEEKKSTTNQFDLLNNGNIGWVNNSCIVGGAIRGFKADGGG